MRVRRAVRAALLPVLILTLLVVLAETPPAQGLVRRLLIGFLTTRLGGSATITSLDYGLLRREMVLTGVAVTGREPPLEVAIDRIEVRLVGWSRVWVRVDHPRVSLGSSREAAGAAPDPRPWMALARVSGVELTRGELRLLDTEGSLTAHFDKLDGKLAEESGQHRLALTGRLVPPTAGDALPLRLDALLRAGSTLEVLEARADLGEARAAANGRITSIAPFEGSLEGKVTGDLTLAGRWPAGAGLAGAIEAAGHYEAEGGHRKGWLQARGPTLRWGDVGPWALDGRAQIEDDTITLSSSTLRGYDGRIEGEGGLALGPKGDRRLRLRYSGLDMTALLRDLRGESVWTPPLASRAGGTVELRFAAGSVLLAGASGTVRLDPMRGDALTAETPDPKAPGLPVGADARWTFAAGRWTVAVERLELPHGKGTVDAKGSRSSSPEGRFRFELDDGADLTSFLARLGFAPPPLRLAGALTAEGTFSGGSGMARVSGPAVRVEGVPYALEAEVSGDDRALQVAPLVLEGKAGRLDATGMIPLVKDASWDLVVESDRFDLAAIARRRGLPASATVSGRAHVQGAFGDPDAEIDLRASAVTWGDAPEPVGEVMIRARKAGRGITVDALDGSLLEGTLDAAGHYDLDSQAMDGRLRGAGLRLGALPGWPPAPGGFDGRIAVTLEASGTTAAPRGTGRVELSDVVRDGNPLPKVSLDLAADGQVIRVTTVEPQGFLSGEVRVGGDWPVRLEIDVGAVPFASVLAAFPRLREGGATVSGTGTIVLETPARAPRLVKYHASILGLEGQWSERSWTTSAFRVEGDLAAMTIEGLELRGDLNGHLRLEGRVPFDQQGKTDVALSGELPLPWLSAAYPNTAIDGMASLDLKATGTLSHPDVTGTAILDAKAGRWGTFEWETITARAGTDGKAVVLEEAHLQALGGTLSLTGAVPLPGRTASGLALDLVWTDLDLMKLQPPDDTLAQPRLGLLTGGKGRLTAEALDLRSLRGEGELTLSVWSSEGATAGQTTPARWRVKDGEASIDALELSGPATELVASVGAALTGSWSGSVKGTLDNALVVFLVSNAWSLSGQTELALEARSGPEGLAITGDARLVDARIVSEDPPLALVDLSGRLVFAEGGFEIADVQGRIGSGTLTAAGRGTLGPGGLARLDVAMKADDAEVAYPRGFFGQLSGDMTFTGDGARYRLAGDLQLRHGRYTAEFDAETQSMAALDSQIRSLTGSGETVTSRIDLDLKLRTSDDLRVDNSLVQASAGGSLTVGGTFDDYAVDGSLIVRAGGTVKISRTRATITSGRVELSGYPLESPELDVTLEARPGGTEVQIHVEGRVDNLKMTLTAPQDPELTETDVASLLVTGRRLDTAAREGRQVATETLAAGLGSWFQGEVGPGFTVEVSPEEDLIGDEKDPKTRFRVGKRVSDTLRVTYAVGLDGEDQRWILDWQPRESVRVRGLREANNTYAVEAFHRLSFRIRRRRGATGAGATGAGTTRTRTPGDRTRGPVEIEGALPIPEADLRKSLKGKTGKKFDFWVAQEDEERLRKQLVAAGYWSARVDLETTRDGARTAIRYHVDAGERVIVTWTGDDPGERVREQAEAAWDPNLPSDGLPKRVALHAQWALRADRYYCAEVTAAQERDPDTRRVTLNVVRGPRGRSVRLHFPGSHALSEKQLQAVLPGTKTPELFAMIGGEDTSRLALTLRGAYAARGFLEAKTGRPEATFDAASGRLDVTIPVEEGERRLIAAIDLPLPEGGHPPRGLLLAKGKPLSVTDYVHDRAVLGQYYREQGYPEARVKATVKPAPEGLNLTYEVDSGPVVRVGAIQIRRSEHIKESLIRRTLPFREGDILRPSDLAKARRQLSQIGVFRSVDVRAVASPKGPDTRDVVVDLAERAGIEVDYGLRYRTGDPEETDPSLGRSQDALEGAGRVGFVNPFGNGIGVGLFGLISTQREVFGVRLSLPRLFGPGLPTQVYLRNELKDVEGFDEKARTLSTTVQQQRSLTERIRVQWSYAYSRERGPLFLEDGTLLPSAIDRGSVNLSLIGDARDSFTNPKRGHFWSGNASMFATALGSDETFVRLYGQFYLYRGLGPFVWAQGIRTGVIPGDDKTLVPDDRFQSGGASTMRGFSQDGLGPQTPGGVALGGRGVFVFNEELRFRIWKSLEGGAFFDWGNVFVRPGDFSLGALRENAGLGLRYVLSFGVLRVDWARVLDPKPGEKKDRFLFSLGHAF